jgi:hypothetical protein
LNYEQLQKTIESLRLSGVWDVAESIRQADAFKAAERLKDDGVLDMAESLERSGSWTPRSE